MLLDLQWWLCSLIKPDFFCELFICGPIQDLGLFVDASTSWGIGIVVGGEWAAFKLHEGWKIPGQDICWLKTVPVEMLVYILEAKGIKNATLLIHSNNQGTIGSLDKGRSQNFHINLSIHCTYLVLALLFITPHLVYITSEANPADPISRGKLGITDMHISTSFSLPDELRQLFVNV
jgi:hypothetical protein